ncbi:PREDICTED: L-type lectin-domain containing receptor kinase IX.1-like [Fragaria vesca subsp. vesca]|uniref:L-type lectin-domain containing receptor kinase IX.1-like n=1 Tax=Fragaria vesca subsp. vesca TaxID=101020 RepID=UPI0002C362FB|nr:PREDICTED: L-type lectin-domain containing receptor kinase IX.1-like [Fragaria vesca subsp. vesca]
MSLKVICGQAIFSLFIFIKFLTLFAHTTSFSIPHFSPGTENILYEGDATIKSGNVEFNPQFDIFRVGRCTYSKPFQLWDSTTPARSLSNFTTNFTFMMDTNGEEPFTDGFAFFLAPFGYPIPPNSAGGDLGLFNITNQLDTSQNRVVLVEFDTYSNEWDPKGPHVGININSLLSVVNASWDFNVNKSRKVISAQVTYNASTYMLTVFWKYNEATTYENPLPFKIDLRDVLPERVAIGFSAATGTYPENLIISTWEFNSDLDSDDSSRKGNKRAIFLIAAMTVVTFFILMLGVALYWSVVKKRIAKIKGQNNVVVPSVSKHLETLAFPRRFSYKELVAATFGFANDRRLGHGGSGQVYKGVLQDLGCSVAVKRIFADSEHYEKVFINEVKIISRLIHKNLVMFIGWCHEQGECLLVYAYMPNSSLDAHLFGPRTTLQWDIRYKIALGLASALHYLHEDAEQCILHRDIKSANVLLDNDFNMKLGDFGIAKLLDPHLRTRTTGVAGTFGYMAPEYAFQGRASKESDMFSFGVVALEIACGRQTYQDGEYHVPLSEWVWQSYLAESLLDVADERLDMKFDPSEMKCLLIVGLWCTHPSNKERPKAGQVMKVLQLEAPLPQLACNRHHDHHQYNVSVLPDPGTIL